MYLLVLGGELKHKLAYPGVEFRGALEFLASGVFLWSTWVVMLAALKGPNRLSAVSSLWWLLCALACLSVLFALALFLTGASLYLSSVTEVWFVFSVAGSPLLLLPAHWWYLRRRFGD